MCRINIVVPVYNVEPYLVQFMESLSCQTYQDFDITAVDDNSQDDSVHILERYQGIFGKRMQIIRNQSNQGPGNARNIGLMNLPPEGEYVLFLDSDDYVENIFIEKMVKTADKYQADLTICGIDRVDSKTGLHTKGEMISNPEQVIEGITNCKQLAYMNTFLYNKLMRREFVEMLRFPPMKRWEEFTFLFKYLPKVKRIKFINEVLYHYRQREDSLTGGISEETYNVALIGLQSEIAFLQNYETSYQIIKPLFEVQVFMRCGLGGVCRLSLKNMRKANFYVRQVKNYLDTNIKGWRNNPYLMIHGFQHRSLKENAVMIAALLYKSNLFILFVWVYWFTIYVLKKDVRY